MCLAIQGAWTLFNRDGFYKCSLNVGQRLTLGGRVIQTKSERSMDVSSNVHLTIYGNKNIKHS